MTRILGIDTETTGFLRLDLPPDSDQQPRPVQIAAVLSDENFNIQHSINFIVAAGKPSEPGAVATHGITDERAEFYGLSSTTAISMLYALVTRADVIVGHNLDYDVNVIKLEKLRLGLQHSSDLFDGKEHFCTQKKSTGIVRLPPTDKMVLAGMHEQFKPPKLHEAYKFFFDEEISGAHDAMTDLMASMRIYFHIKKLEEMSRHV